MNPAGRNNYPIEQHDVLFWAVYLGAAITLTLAMLGLFLFMVHRNSQSTLARVPPSPAASRPDGAPLPAPDAPHAA